MNSVIYYYDEEAGLNVKSESGEHFQWYLKNKINMSKDEFELLIEDHKQDIVSNYVAEYIPR